MNGTEPEAGPPEEVEVEVEIPSEKNADLIMGVSIRGAYPLPPQSG